MADTPSVGRIVHYVRNSSGGPGFPQHHYAAIVTELPEETNINDTEQRVGLSVFDPHGLKIKSLENGGVKRDDNNTPGTWHWPERV